MSIEPRVFQLLHLSYKAVFRAADKVLMTRYGISAAQNAMLLYLLRHEGATMGQVAVALGLKNAAVSGLVDRMERNDLVERRPSASDGRAYELYLRPYGRDTVEKSKSVIRMSNERLLEGFTEEERALMSRFFETIIERADQFSTFNFDDTDDDFREEDKTDD
ncbi:MarR family winged helix-turn-helix transcriptional regulator [Kordiimonas aestuarii]|uniref:MarR family winged helix-turn-helix transcriptional regulator n=1 Tax=Kordiimonas aestuarii TaxID=1005925 RepID=UPI0021CE8C3B|nr:MarR family transcriptional regulator [Kordiimonas aestuarii]